MSKTATLFLFCAFALVGLSTEVHGEPIDYLTQDSSRRFNFCVQDYKDCGGANFCADNLSSCCGSTWFGCWLDCAGLTEYPGYMSKCQRACDSAERSCLGGKYVSPAEGEVVSLPELWLEDFFPTLAYTKRTGDFDGDGLEDVLVFTRAELLDYDWRQGDVYVAPSDGRGSFLPRQKWYGWFCAYNDELCDVGDFNGDGRDDIVLLQPGGAVAVGLSTGSSFAVHTHWWDGASTAGMSSFDVADMNGDGRDDVVLFSKGTGSNANDGDVVVLLSSGVDSFEPYTTGGAFPGCMLTAQGCNLPVEEHPVWHENFCYGDDRCFAGDLDGDGLGDLVAFRPDRGDVLYTPCGYSWGSGRYKCFDLPSPLPFPMLSLSYGFDDVDGDGQADLVGFASEGSVTFGTEFLRDTSSGSPVLELTIADAAFDCKTPQACQMADVNGDTRADLVEFTIVAGGRGLLGDVWVSLAPFFDNDGDGVPNETDNCPLVANEDQADADGDGIGDACPTDCSDGLDNDGDGVKDVNDPGCSSSDDLSERTPDVQCDDGADNDGDGSVDYPADPQCASPSDNREARSSTPTRCGLGFEFALLLPLWMALRSRRTI